MAGTTFSTILQTLRKNRGVTQEQLATHLGVSPQAVSKWENGSYPDGDLLPQIADYFEVSIDYLYGRAKDDVSIEQQIMDAIKGISVNEKFEHYEHFEQTMRYIWATIIGCWPENGNYYERHRSEGSHVVGASIIDNAGFNFFRLNKSLEFFAMVKEPEEGFASYFKVTAELENLFTFLGKKENLKVLFYMLTLDNAEGVSVATIAKRIGISEEAAKEAMEYLIRMAEKNLGNQVVQQASVLNEYDKKENVYIVDKLTSTSVLLLLAAADTMLHPPGSFSPCIGGRQKAWFERDRLDFLQKPGKR